MLVFFLVYRIDVIQKSFFLLVLPTRRPVNICMHSALQTVAKGDFIDFLIFSSEAGGRRAGDYHGDVGAVQCGGRILFSYNIEHNNLVLGAV